MQIVTHLLSRSAATKEEATDALLAASTVLNSAKTGSVKPDTAVLNQTASEIMKSQDKYPELPAVWQATSAFINYRSNALLAPSSRPSLSRGVACVSTLGGDGWVFKNCEVSLEDLATHITGSIVNGAPATFTFVNCIVHYSGGAIPAKDLYFANSILEFQVRIVPSPAGILAMRQLTTADPNSHISL